MDEADSADRSASTAVIEAVAAEKGVDPIDLECVLADVIDPLALDTLFQPTADGPRNSSGRVVFSFGGCLVVLRADGTVDVR
ncbi:HalOD1 output domain-containing protein [Natrinema sp. 1APR25-10V2]|uniref:HalOD1 output domain-containing protein n=1 Tax=Natrinema sp. 1APR25-10V2 TaxID=2951081 RepID=UPI0028744083|nr:HalOD1 output domain-containing protein [Natrinema sp. 1APR25-10V2]MDS0477754.1 hypothetical protein [Natrinema sp. 1APR25-10V2]